MNLLLAKTAAVVAAAFVAGETASEGEGDERPLLDRNEARNLRVSASSHSRIQITENKEKNQGPTKRARLLNIIDIIYVVWININNIQHPEDDDGNGNARKTPETPGTQRRGRGKCQR